MSAERADQPGVRRVSGVPAPPVVDRDTFEGERAALLEREKAATREAAAIAATRRRLPMVEVDATAEVVGPDGPATLLDVFEGRRMLLAYFVMWYEGHAAAHQCEGCTWNQTEVGDLTYLHSRDITYAALCQGPYEPSRRYRDFMGWTMPWWSAQPSLETLLDGRNIGQMHLVSYLRDDDGRVFETYWTTNRGVEVVDVSYHLMDLTPYGRQEPHEDSPDGWPQEHEGYVRLDGRPIPQWSRLAAGRSDDIGPVTAARDA